MKRRIEVLLEEARDHADWLKGGIPSDLYKYLVVLSLLLSFAYVSVYGEDPLPVKQGCILEAPMIKWADPSVCTLPLLEIELPDEGTVWDADAFIKEWENDLVKQGALELYWMEMKLKVLLA